MSRTQYIKRRWSELGNEEKIVGISSFVLFVSCFLPWYYGPAQEVLLSRFGVEYVNFIGFQSYAYILGYLVFFCSSVCLYNFVTNLFELQKLPFSINYNAIYPYLGERALMFEIIALFIYTRQSFEYTQAEVRFGLYLGLTASILMTVFGYLYVKNQDERSKQRTMDRMMTDAVRESSDDEESVSEKRVRSVHLEPDVSEVTRVSTGMDAIQKAKQEVLGKDEEKHRDVYRR